MKQERILATLQAINSLLEVGGPVAAAAIALGTLFLHKLKSSGTDIKPFAEEIAKLEAAIAPGITVDDAWRSEHGLPTWKSGE